MAEILPPLKVKLYREPWCDYVQITYVSDQGNTVSEELDADDTREWFNKRGADMDKIEKILDYIWNFYKAEVTIENPKRVAMAASRIQPQI